MGWSPGSGGGGGGGGGPPTGAAGGDLAGSYPNPTIAALAVTNAKMAAGAAAANLGGAGGDLTGSYPNPTLVNTGPGATGPVGDSSHVARVTIDAKGRVTALTSVAIASSTGTVSLVTSADGTVVVTNPAGPTVDLSAPAAANKNPWATSTTAPIAAGNTTFAVVDALPAAKRVAGISQQRLFLVVDPWTTVAELVFVTVNSAGTGLTLGSPGFQNTHPAGCPVILVEDFQVHPEWWGAVADVGGNATQNVAAFANMLTQLGAGSYSNPNTDELAVVGSCGHASRGISKRYYPINSTITLFSGLASFSACTFLCTGDFGAGTAAVDCSQLSDGVNVYDCQVVSSNAQMSMAQFLAGGSAPPVAMDGFHFTQRAIVERCVAMGFRAGFLLDFADHSKFSDCHAGNNMYGYAFQHAGQDGGDMSFTKCDSDGAYRAAWGLLASGHGPSGVSWRDCSWTNNPFTFYGDGGFQILDGQMINCNTEFTGNGFAYSSNGMIFWCNVHAPSTTVCYASGGTWTDPNFPGAAAFQVAAGDLTFRDGFFTATYPGGVSYVFDVQGAGNFVCSNGIVRTDTNGGPAGLVKNANSGSGASGTLQVREFASGSTNTRISGTVLAGDLMEQLNTGGVAQRYQTAGKPAYGFAFWDAINSNATLLTSGATIANVYAGSVAAFKYVKPDLANPGGVAQATDFTDGPIVGFSVGASSGGKVTIRMSLV